MASEQTRRVYKKDDKLDERLLNQISKWIYYHRLPSLARHLGISDAEITRIMIPSRTSEEQCFQVRFVANFILLRWHNITIIHFDLSFNHFSILLDLRLLKCLFLGPEKME